MIKVDNLFKKYNSKLVLGSISFVIETGTLAVIYGLNGAGKTTLIKCLVGLIKTIDNPILLSSNKADIGLYLGHEMLIEKLTVKEYLFFTASLKGLPKDAIESKIMEFTKKLHFEDFLNQYISKISFGTKSKVLFVASIIGNPKILIMDEPFLGIDLLATKEIITVLSELKKEGCTILISSHQVDILENVIDKILILKDHKIILDRNMNELNKNIHQLSDIVLSYLQ